MKKVVSIIIPMYNIEKYIIDCLKSIESQNIDGYEVIIVDDGSTDKSADLVDNFILDKPQYIKVYQKNGGLSDARNTGINVSKGEFLFFLDGDDMLSENSLSSLIRYLNNSDSDVIICHYDEFDDSDGKENAGPNLLNYRYKNAIDFYNKFVNIDKNWISAWCCIVRRSFLINSQLFFYKGILHEDELWVPMVFTKIERLSLFNRPLYKYRINRKGSIMASVTYRHLHDKLFICRKLFKIRNRCSLHPLNRRICNDMISIILSIPLLDSKYDKKKICQDFNKSLFCLKTPEGYYIYMLVKILGVSVLSKMISLRKRDMDNA